MAAKEGVTFGSKWMYKSLICIIKHTNLRVIYTFMAIIIIPFTLVFSPGARLTLYYFRRKKGYGKCKSIWMTYLNHVIFGQTVIDKFAMYAGHRFEVDYIGLEAFQELTQQDSALIQLSAHIGCSEIVGYSYENKKKSNVLVYGGEKNDFMRYREQAFGNQSIKMIPVGTSEDHSNEIIMALDNNEIVYAFADRFMNNNKVIISTLHNHKIKLAKGPFSMAVTRGLPVVMTSAMKERNGSYKTFMTRLYYDKKLSKREQCQQLADAYTAEIERLLFLYPCQWFNYSNIWEN